jgi:hypothetical protein
MIDDIIVDVDAAVRDVVLTIHWRGGQHSELRIRKPQTGEHGCATTDDALAVRSMFVLVIGVSMWFMVEVAKLHLDPTPRWPPRITPLVAMKLHQFL